MATSSSPKNPAPVQVLLVEDNPGDARLIAEILAPYEKRFQLAGQVTRLADAEAAVEKPGVDLVLLDLSLPDSQGFETFERLLSHGRNLPILVLSGVDDESLALKMVHAGAQDYLVKGSFDGALLSRAMHYAMERNCAEQELAAERNLLRALMATVPDRIYFKDQNSQFVRINHAMARFFGLSGPDEAIGKSDFDFFMDSHARQAQEDEQEIMRSGKPILEKVEEEPLPDGRIGWALTTKMALRDRTGRIIGTMGVSHDITRMKRIEDELTAERNLLKSVLENIPDPIFVKDAHGVYLLDNEAHCKTLGVVRREDVIGKTSFDFFPAADAAAFKADDDRVVNTGEPMENHEECVQDAHGRKRWLLTTKAPVLNDDTGIVERLVCIRRDITQQKEAEEKLRATNGELSTALENLRQASEQLRSIQLQLIEAEKMKSIGRLAAGVAHEVKNPLAIITMGVDYLEGQPSNDSTVSEILEEMRSAVKRADNVIRGLLDFSAPRQLELGDESLVEVIEHALMLVRGEMTGNKFQTVTKFEPGVPNLRLDKNKVEQVFVNILTNAIHAMPEGGTLTVRVYAKQLTGVGENIGGAATEVFRAGDHVVVAEVDDTGSGIPDNKLGKIFDPFFTTKPTGKGTGLGLTVTRSIIDLHGGTIEINNRPEGGARATIMLKA